MLSAKWIVALIAVLLGLNGPTEGRFRPAERHADTVVVWIHGGGWTGGSPTEGYIYDELRSMPEVTLLIPVEYPLGQGAWPANLEAVQAALDGAARIGERVVAVGWSAGGSLLIWADTTRIDHTVTFGAPPDLDEFNRLGIQPYVADVIASVFGDARPVPGPSGAMTNYCGTLDPIVVPELCTQAPDVHWVPDSHAMDRTDVSALVHPLLDE